MQLPGSKTEFEPNFGFDMEPLLKISLTSPQIPAGFFDETRNFLTAKTSPTAAPPRDWTFKPYNRYRLWGKFSTARPLNQFRWSCATSKLPLFGQFPTAIKPHARLHFLLYVVSLE